MTTTCFTLSELKVIAVTISAKFTLHTASNGRRKQAGATRVSASPVRFAPHSKQIQEIADRAAA